MPFWSRKTFCLISGGGRGYGATIGIHFAEHFPSDSVIVLLGRDSINLNKTKLCIEKKRPDLKVFTWVIDLLSVDVDELGKHFLDLFAKETECQPSKFTQCLIVHNAASLGNVSVPLSELLNKKEIEDYWSLNLTSCILLNSVFFSFFPKSPPLQRYVIQISSLGAISPFLHWGVYCAAKAARDMMFKTMAKEDEGIKILSYAPGPLNTDMFQEAVNESTHPITKALFEDLAADGVLSCEQSASRLVKILRNGSFESGSHVDYYDFNDEGYLVSEPARE